MPRRLDSPPPTLDPHHHQQHRHRRASPLHRLADARVGLHAEWYVCGSMSWSAGLKRLRHARRVRPFGARKKEKEGRERRSLSTGSTRPKAALFHPWLHSAAPLGPKTPELALGRSAFLPAVARQ